MSFLDELLAATRVRLAESRGKLTEEALEQRIASRDTPRGFTSALRRSRPALIAEIKRATPAKGALDLDLDARKLAAAYAAGGASAISVLTEPDRFKGSLEDMEAALEVELPVLRKDFLIDPWQVMESRAWGADAVLLIVRILGDRTAEMMAAAAALGMDALVEVFDETDLERALEAGADLIGINHRDLETFEVDPERTAKLAPQVPDGVLVVALSGITGRTDVETAVAAGASAVLVGEALVRAADPAAKIEELMGR
jgi:indole-3-glycerol phosphate synthase